MGWTAKLEKTTTSHCNSFGSECWFTRAGSAGLGEVARRGLPESLRAAERCQLAFTAASPHCSTELPVQYPGPTRRAR